jgi:hypothetical protein
MFGEMLETLKTKLVEAGDFGPVMNYFFDISEKPRFHGLGKRVSNEMLESVIQIIGGQIFGGSVRVSNLLLLKIPSSSFIHGVYMVQGIPGNVFYFEDIDVGLAAVLVPGEGTRIVRFSAELGGYGGNGNGNGNGQGNGDGDGKVDGLGKEESRPMTPQEKRKLRKRLKERLERAKKKKKRPPPGQSAQSP